MKVSLTKVLIHGAITTTLLMSMSCQKKGTAKDIQPETVEKADNDNNRQTNKVPSVDNLATGTSKDNSPVIPAATSEEEKAAVEAVTPTTEVVQVKDKDCSERIVKSQKKMAELYTKMIEAEKVSTISNADKISSYTIYYNECLNWKKIFIDEKIKSCVGEVSINNITAPFQFKPESYKTTCIQYAAELTRLTGLKNTITRDAEAARAVKIKELKSKQFIVSDEAKDMFSEINIKWNMFIVEGEIKKDDAELTNAIDDKKIACTVLTPVLDKLTDSQKVIVAVTGVSELTSKLETDKVKSGVKFAISIKVEDKDATAEEKAKIVPLKSVISCSGIKINDVGTEHLKKAFGTALTLKTDLATTTSPDNTEI